MKLIDINRHPTDRQLKQFGIAALLFLPLIGWLATGKPRTLAAANLPLLGSLAAVGLVFALLAFLKPRALQPVFVGASLVTLPIGLVVGEVVLLVIFFGLFTPMGLLFRLLGRDALQRRLDRGAKTYWQPKRQPDSPARYYQQF
jgi:hypothetical protein